MSAQNDPSLHSSGTVQATMLEEIVQRFEDAFRRGEQPAIEDFLPEGEEARRVARVELMHTDLECRLKAGLPACVEDYLGRFPDLAADVSTVVDLIAAEYRFRRRREPGLSWQVLLDRFPTYRSALLARMQERSTLRGDTLTNRPSAGSDVSWPSIPGYEVLGALGKGGMGIVYRAHQVNLKRQVALKMIRDRTLAGPDELVRFHREAETLAQLQHANIVQVYEVGEHDGFPYFALELVEGQSLAEWLAGVPQPALPAAQLVETLARAMHAAHQRGVIHRDLKPANILLQQRETTNHTKNTNQEQKSSPASDSCDSWFPKITDFGLAKRLDTDQGQTQSGAVLGTPSYMAPEQAAGRVHEVGVPADVYALGAILYELLTGRPPFKGATTLETIWQVLDQEPVPVRQLQPRTPRDLETVCLKCLEKDPTKRYRSAQELADDLRRFRDGEPAVARPAGTAERAWKWVRRRPLAAAAWVLGLLALGFGSLFGGAALRYHETADALGRVEAEKKKTDAALGRAEQAEANFRLLSYFRNVDLAHREYLASQVARSNELLDACPEKLRQWEWRYVERLCNSELFRMEHEGKYVWRVACSPNSKWIASTGADRAVRLHDATTGKEVRVLRGLNATGFAVAFSPDSRWVVAGGGGQDGGWGGGPGEAHAWDLAATTDRPARSLPALARTVSLAYFTADGKAVLRVGAALEPRDLQNTAAPQELPLPKGASDAVLAPDGKLCAVAVAQGSLGRSLELREAQSGKLLKKLHTFSNTGIASLALARDGKRLAAGTPDGQVWCWAAPADGPAGEWKLLLAARGHSLDVLALDFSPDGRTLASGSMDQTAKLWDVTEHPAAAEPSAAVSGLPRELLTIRGHTEDVFDLAFTADGKRLVTAGDQSVKVWDVAWIPDPSPPGPRTGPPAGQQARALAGVAGMTLNAAFSPDGKWLAFGTGRSVGTQRFEFFGLVVDPATGRQVARTAARQQPTPVVAFDLAGHLLTGEFGRIQVWDLASAKNDVMETPVKTIPIPKLANAPPFPSCLATSPDGTRLAASSHGGVAWVWDAADGKLLHTLPAGGGGPVFAVAFSPDGTALATAGGKEGRIYDTATGKQQHVLTGHTRLVSGVCFSPDGRTVATCSHDNTTRLYEAATGAFTEQMHGHNHYLAGVAFSPDGKRLADACHDLTIKVWDPAEKQDVLTLRGHADQVLSVTFSPDRDGRFLASTSQDGVVLIWDATPVAGRKRADERFRPVTPGD